MRRKRILIVDDDARFTRVVKTTLERTGSYDVWEDNEGTNALELAQEMKPDLVFLDIQMPATTGAFVAGCMRNDPGLKDVPIIYITAIVPKLRLTEARDLGGFPFIAKPVVPEELIACIRANISDE